MRSTLKAGIIEAVQQCPGIGVADLAARLGADKGNVRRFTLELERDGKLVARKDADGYRFFPVGFAMPDRKNAVDHQRRDGAPVIIDADFREIPVVSSESRALVVHGAAQPADNRMAGAVAAADKARRRQGGVVMPVQYAATLNGLFELDPDGNQTMNALTLAEVASQRETLAHERAEAARALAARPREPTQAELWKALGWSAIGVFDTMMTNARERARAQYDAETKQPGAVEPVIDHYRQQRAEAEAREAKETEARCNHVTELLTRSRTSTSPEAKTQPQASGLSWLRARFATPVKPVFK